MFKKYDWLFFRGNAHLVPSGELSLVVGKRRRKKLMLDSAFLSATA
ncbi:MAG: hypothetical protein ACUVRP_00185 [Chlorobiales bacterium]